MTFLWKKITDPVEWDQFVSISRQTSLFCYSRHLNSLGLKYDTWGIAKDGKMLLGVLVVVDNNKFKNPLNFARYNSILLAEEIYQYPLHYRLKEMEDLMAYALGLLEVMYVKFSLMLHPDFTDIRPFQWYNTSKRIKRLFIMIRPEYTGYIALDSFDSFEDYLKSITTNRKRDYQKALKLGLEVEKSTDFNILEDLCIKTFARRNATINWNMDALRSMLATAQKSGYGDILICRDREGTPLSAVLLLYDRRSGYSVIIANDPKGRNAGSGTMVILESIRYCMERKIGIFDFCGMNNPDWADFKHSFEATPTLYFQISAETETTPFS